jgi:hypothetical protein
MKLASSSFSNSLLHDLHFFFHLKSCKLFHLLNAQIHLDPNQLSIDRVWQVRLELACFTTFPDFMFRQRGGCQALKSLPSRDFSFLALIYPYEPLERTKDLSLTVNSASSRSIRSDRIRVVELQAYGLASYNWITRSKIG